MKRNRTLDTKKIAAALGAEHEGVVAARGGHFGAMQLVAEIRSRFQTPRGGGRPTDPDWTAARTPRRGRFPDLPSSPPQSGRRKAKPLKFHR